MTRYNLPIMPGSQLVLALLVLVLVGCDAQATPDYSGEALLALRGNVRTGLDTSDSLVPALVFEGKGYTYFLDTEHRGSFPSSFQLAVHERPPAEVFRHRPTADSPGVARAYLVAAKAEHPKEAVAKPVVVGMGGSGGSGFSEDRDTLLFADGSSATITTKCLGDPPKCDTTIEGDLPDNYEPTEPYIAGYAQNFMVFYFEAPVAADSELAASLGGPAPAGYNLYRLHRPTMKELEAAAKCDAAAHEQAVAAVNDEFDLDAGALLDPRDGAGMGSGDDEPPDSIAGLTPKQVEAIQEAYLREHEAAWKELGCVAVRTEFERIEAPADVSIAIDLGSSAP